MTNIVLVIMDTARYIDVDESSMPRLHEIGKRGVTFQNADANAPWTLPSHGSLFSGQYPSVHGTHTKSKYFDYDFPLARLLNEAGYRTVGISNNTWISSEFGFDEGFDEFIATWQLFQDAVDFGDIAQTETDTLAKVRSVLGKLSDKPLKDLANLLYGKFLRRRNDDGARRTNKIIHDQITEWQAGEKPFFLFVNYLEPHLEYRPTKGLVEERLPRDITYSEAMSINQDAWAYITGEHEMTERDFHSLRCLYRAEIEYLDRRIQELRNIFADDDLLDETVFIITSDHGENIGDNGLMDHQYSLHDTLTRVPLVIEGPGFDSRTVHKPVQLLDLFPTILDISGIVFDDIQSPGESLRDTDSLSKNRPIFSEYVAPQPPIGTLMERYDCTRDISIYDRRLWSICKSGKKLIKASDGSEYFFDRDGDSVEQGQSREDVSGVWQRLREQLEAWKNTLPTATAENRVNMSEETKSRLEDLGYLQ